MEKPKQAASLPKTIAEEKNRLGFPKPKWVKHNVRGGNQGGGKKCGTA